MVFLNKMVILGAFIIPLVFSKLVNLEAFDFFAE